MTLSYRRLLIGLDHHAECRAALDFVSHVAAAAAAEVELAGIFVEDQQLLELARLPFSTEFLQSSNQTRALNNQNVESELRAMAGVMHKALRQIATRAKHQHSFVTVRGNLIKELIARAGAGDLVLLRTATAAWRHAAAARMKGPVVLLALSEAGKASLLELGREIARETRQELVIAPHYDGPQSIAALRAHLILVPGSDFSPDQIERLINAVDCPVLIVPTTA